MKSLIITADDFGASSQVNEAVERAHVQGVLSAASLMVSAPGAAEAVAIAQRTPSLAVGLHLVLVEGRPTLPPDQVPDLVDESGLFRIDMVRAGVTLFFLPAARRQLAAEITAQFEAYAATGLVLDHVNAHKHFHLHPTIAGLILKIGARFGLNASRLPIEPRGVLARIEPQASYPAEPVVDLWAAWARRRFRAAGLTVPDQVFGLRWSGAMSAKRLGGVIAHLPPGLSEVYLHPATDRYEGSAPGYGYVEELAALTDPTVIAAVRVGPIALGGFGAHIAGQQTKEPLA